MRKTYTLTLLALSHCAAAWLGYRFAHSYSSHSIAVEVPESQPIYQVLDGDTFVRNGIALHVKGIDAPELGPWANCWAEAALAGHAKTRLESALFHGNWKVVESGAGHSVGSVDLVRDDGDTVRELMVVGGYAAETEARWEWCKTNTGMRQVLDGEPAPHGPSLWWPTGTVFDERAND
jgi:endonuclease YncB( thermonuclease family)